MQGSIKNAMIRNGQFQYLFAMDNYNIRNGQFQNFIIFIIFCIINIMQ